MTSSLDRLDVLLGNILQRVSDEKLKSTAEALIPAMPDVIASLRVLISDSATSQSTRLRANELVYKLWSRCTRLHDKAGDRTEVIARAGARRESAKARTKRLEVESKEQDRKEEKRKQVAARKLADAITAAEKLGGINAS